MIIKFKVFNFPGNVRNNTRNITARRFSRLKIIIPAMYVIHGNNLYENVPIYFNAL